MKHWAQNWWCKNCIKIACLGNRAQSENSATKLEPQLIASASAIDKRDIRRSAIPWRIVFALNIALALLCLTLLASKEARAGQNEATPHTLEFVTEDFPPFNFSNGGKVDGFSAELIQELLRREKLSAPMTLLPWPRAYKMAQIEPNVGIFSMVRSPEREKLFQWVGPIGNLDSKVYVKHDSSLQLATLNDARDAKHIILLREGYHAQKLERLGFTNLVMVNNPTEGLRLLMISNDRSVLLVPSDAIPEALHRTATPPDAIKPILSVMQAQVYIGFSLDTPPALITRLQHTLDAMKSDGSFALLYQKWLPGEKPPAIEPDQSTFPF